VGGDFWNNKNLTKKFIGGKSLNKGKKSDNFFPPFPCFLNLPPSSQEGGYREIKSSPTLLLQRRE